MNSEPGSEGPKKQGRPLDCIKSHFTQNVAKPVEHNRYWWTCKYCDTDVVGRDNNLSTHILTTCRKVPGQTRTVELARIANEPRPLPKKLRSLTCGSSADQGAMRGFVDSGLPSDIAEQVTKELLRACITGGIPFSLVDNPHFRRAVALLQPSYVLPSAHLSTLRFLTVVLPACCAAQSREAYL